MLAVPYITGHITVIFLHTFQTIFKSLPGVAINRISLGGVLGSPQDKIFVASNAEVRAFSRKGKKFLDFNTNLTESVTNL